MGAGRKVLALLVLTFVYLFIGASIFSAIESAHEQRIKSDLYGRLETFVERNPSVNASEFREVLLEVWYAASIGVERMVGQENYTLPSSRWDLANAFFFSATVITTIGYGHLSPATVAGQNFCIAYALGGIPLMAILLSEISSKWKQRLVNAASHLDTRLVNVLKRHKVRRVASTILLVIPAYVIIIIIPATVFSYIEGWDFLVAHYYCFISLSTIGLGDYVATQRVHQNKALVWVYKIGTTLYLIVGLGIMTILFHGVRTKQRKHTPFTFRQRFAKILRKRRKPWLKIMEEQADVISDNYPVQGGVISSAVAAAAVAVTVNNTARSCGHTPQNDFDSGGMSSDNNGDSDFNDDDSLDDQCRSRHCPQKHKQINTRDIRNRVKNPNNFLDPASEEDPPSTFQSVTADSHPSISVDLDSEDTEERSRSGKTFNDIDHPKHSRKSSLPQRLDFRNFGAHKRDDGCSTPRLSRTLSQPQTLRNIHNDVRTEGGALASNLAQKKLWSPSGSYAGEDSGIHAASSQSTVEMESTV